MDMSTPKRPQLHLDVSTLQRSVLYHGCVYSKGSKLHLDLSRQQEPMLRLDLLTPKETKLHMLIRLLYKIKNNITVAHLFNGS